MDEIWQKHLEMIQAVISRMAANSFALKGWSVTAATALLAFAAGSKHPWVALVALLPTCVFWALDGYYLALERRYRALFRKVAAETGSPPAQSPFDMNARTYEGAYPWGKAVCSRSVLPVHGSTVLAVAIVAGVIGMLPERKDEAQHVRVEAVVPVRTVLAADSACLRAGGGVARPRALPPVRNGSAPRTPPSP